MAQASGWLPKLSRLAGKALTSSWEQGKAGTSAAARGGARLAGECAREFVEGLKEGKAPLARMQMVPLEQAMDARKPQFRGDTDGDV